MIKMDRNIVAAPLELALTETSPAGKERIKTATFFEESKNATKPYTFKAYKLPAVVKALNDLFHAKCAYCESDIRATQPTDVEHFRPKGGYDVYDRIKKKDIFKQPGYHWLAATWENLLPSCIHCNREQYQEFLDGQVIKVGKGNKFPLSSERARATRMGEETREKPLLLNPCDDLPEEHLEFTDEGVVRPAKDQKGRESKKGKTSIQVYGLQRIGLVQRRLTRALEVKRSITQLKLFEEMLDQQPGHVALQLAMAEEIRALKRYSLPTAEYSGMARQLIQQLYGKIPE